MKKLMVLGIILSLFAFGGSSDEVKKAHAAEVVPESGTSAMFFGSWRWRNLTFDPTTDVTMPPEEIANYKSGELVDYKDSIVDLKLSNNASDIPATYVERIAIRDCLYSEDGVSYETSDNVISAYISDALGSTVETPRHKCVLYANADKIYANPNSSYMFESFHALEQLDIKILDTSKVTNMNYMFDNCMQLSELDVSHFDTSNVIDMDSMFNCCMSLRQLDITNFETLNVENMGFMFSSCISLEKLNIDVTKFNTTKVKEMNAMFQGCSKLTQLDTTGFDTSNVTNMSYMFSGCQSLTQLDVSHFDTSNVTDMSDMFGWCSSLTILDLSSFNTTNVTSMSDMFNSCASLIELNLSSFDLSNCTTENGSNGLLYFFEQCDALESIKAPKALPAESTTNPDLALKLPEQFNKYCGVSELTADNLSKYSTISYGTNDIFAYNWRALRNGENSICDALTAGTYENSRLIELLNQYDNFDETTKASINATIDKDGVTIGESIEYVKNVLNGSQKTEGDYDIAQEDSGLIVSLGVMDNSLSLIVIISLLGVLSVLGYYVYNKKKQAM